MSGKLSEFVKKNYPDSKSDLSTCFMEQTLHFCKLNGTMAMINIPVWMFLSSYEKLRHSLLNGNSFINMLHFGRGVFGSDFGTTSFVITKRHLQGYRSSYRRLFEKSGSVDTLTQKEEWFLQGVGQYTAVSDNFGKIPGSPVAYWVNQSFLMSFAQPKLSKVATVQEGLKTADNSRFIRKWHEIEMIKSNIYGKINPKWILHTKGGAFRRWYGNLEDVLNYENEGMELRNFKAASLTGTQNYYKENITWSRITSAKCSFRYTPSGSIPNMAGLALYAKTNLLYILAFLNTPIATN